MSRLNKLQKHKFIEVVEEHFARYSEKSERKTEFWNQITNEINSFGPITRSPDEWKDAFRHMRYKASRKILENMKLTSDELRVNLLDRKVKQIRWNKREIVHFDKPSENDNRRATHSTICRICLSNNNNNNSLELRNLFSSENDTRRNDICPAEKIMRLTTIVAPQMGDDLPQSICGNCLNSLEKAYCFKLLCESSDLALRNRTITIEDNRGSEEFIEVNDNLKVDEVSDPDVEPFDIKIENSEPADSPKPDIFCTTLPTLEDFEKKKQLTCEDCGRKFTSTKPFSKHLQSHLKRQAFQCSHCPYKTNSKISIRSHVKSHIVRVKVDKPKSQCIHCGKHFLSRSNMQKHVRLIHLKVKNYQCEECGERFPSRQCVRGHMVKHWKVKLFKCTICPCEYYWYTGIQKHMKKCHPDSTYLTEVQYQKLNGKHI